MSKHPSNICGRCNLPLDNHCFHGEAVICPMKGAVSCAEGTIGIKTVGKFK